MNLLSGAARPDPVAYMSEVAASGPGRALRDRVLREMDLRPGLTVLDVGCGPGTNLEDLASAVTASGTVTGLDRDPVMVAEARRRMAPYGWDFTRYTCSEVVRNASIGRQLARLAAAAGFTIRSVAPYTPLFGDFGEADRILGLTRNSVAAIAAGFIEEARAQRWLTALRSEPFLAAVMIFTVIAEAA